MKLKLYFSILLLTLFISCDNEEVVPRTHPQFSVTMIQEVSSGGAKFRAKMKDYGTEEIIEHGFAYSETQNPRIESSDYVSEKGVPAETFTLTTNYGLVKGRKYFVTAFIRTSNGVVYSEPTEFTSQGSDGFVFEKLELKQPVYFGDTITIFGSKLTTNLQYFEARVNDSFAIVLGLTKESFKVVIPNDFKIERVDDQSVRLNIKVNVAGKELLISEEVRFVEPEFSSMPIQEVFYDGQVVIKGKFLTSEELDIRIRNSSGGEFPLFITDQGDQEIKFMARLNNFSHKGDVVVKVRGKEYLIPNLFAMKGSELKPNQKLRGYSQNLFQLEGFDFIPDNLENVLLTDSETIVATSGFSTNNLLVIDFNRTDLTRFVKVYVNNFGRKSSNFAEIEFIDGYLRWFRMPAEFDDFRFIGESGVSFNGFGYFFLERNVYKVYPKERKIEIVATAPAGVFFLAGGFSYAASNGRIYLGTLNNSATQNSFWEFNPSTNAFNQLADNPSKANKPKLVYATSTHLYFEGGYRRGPNGDIWDDGVFKYSFQSNTWTKMLRKYANEESLILYRAFNYKGSIYNIDQGTNSILPKMNRFNPITETWELYDNLGFYESITAANEYFIIGDWVYSLRNQGVSAFNMVSRSTKRWGNNSNFSSFRFNYSFQSGDKIYAVNNAHLVEFDPDYFDD